MAANRYSAFIDIGVLGGREAEKVLKTTEDIRDTLQSISKIPIALDDGRRANDAFKQLAKSVNDFARGIANGKTQLANTEIGLNKQVAALSRVSAQAKIGKALYKNAIESQVKAEQKLRLAQLQRLEVETKLFERGKTAFNESFKGIPELLNLGPKINKTTASLEVYRNELSRALSIVEIGSNEFRALEDAIAGVEQQLSNAFLSGQTSNITFGPATDLGSVKAFKQREKFEKSIEQQLIRQLAVEERINQANLDDVQKAQLRNQLGEATNQLAANELVLSKQITAEVERQRMSLERAARAKNQGQIKGGTRRTGEFSPITAPKRVQNIQKSAVLVQEKLNTLAAKGVDVSAAKSRVEQLILNTKDSALTLDLATLNALDNELNGIRQILKFENQILQTKKAQTKANKSTDKKGGRNRLQQAAIGGAFPLLFGGGPLSVIGGAVGEFFGPLMGVVGSAIGGAVEEAAVAVSEFGSALKNPTKNLEALAKAAGLAGTQVSSQISLAEFLGAPEIAGSLAEAGVTDAVGAAGVQGLKNLGEESTKLANAFEILRTRVGSAFAPFLTLLSRAGTFLLGGGTQDDFNIDKTKQKEADIRGQLSVIPIQGGGRSTAGKRKSLERESKKLEALNKAVATSEKQINDIIDARLAPLTAAADLEENRLSLTRDVLAEQEGQVRVLNIKKTLTELIVRETNLEKGVEKDKLGILIQQTREQERQAKAARDNAKRMAQIAIQRDVSSQNQRAFQAYQESLDLVRDMEELTLSDAENYEKRLQTSKRHLESQISIKEEQLEMNLLTVKENNLKEAMRLAVDHEIQALRNKQKLTEEQIRQNKILTEDSEQAVKNARALNTLQQKLAAKRDINQMDPSRAFAAGGPGLGFFQQSVLLDANLLEDRTLQLELYNVQIEQLQSRLKNLQSVDPEEILPMQRELRNLQAAKQSYERLQPAIDAARVKQQQFNDAFAMVSPAVNSLINGFSEVIQGTKSAQEAFADFLRTIGDTLVQEGSRMIATYIAIGIAKAFAGLSADESKPALPKSAPQMTQNAIVTPSGAFQGQFAGMVANGGPVESGKPYLVGERGPELFVPGSNGGVMRNEDMRQMMGRSPVNASPSMNFTFETTNIGGQEFVSREQLEAAMATTRRQATNDGARRGMSMTLDKMQNSPRTRSRVGLS